LLAAGYLLEIVLDRFGFRSFERALNNLTTGCSDVELFIKAKQSKRVERHRFGYFNAKVYLEDESWNSS
jgi:hypothetical protein